MGLRYAFDLGTNSIGSAVWRTGPDPAGIFGADAPLELLWSGVRLFKDGRNPKDQQSLAVMRRIPRQARKRRDRFVLRRADLMKALVQAGLMPSGVEARKKLEQFDPYALRAAALDRALTPHEIGRAFFHLNQRRGFKSNRKTDKADKDKGKIATASAKLRAALREHNSRTFGEFLWMRHRGQSHDPRHVRDPGRKSTRIRIEGEGAKALYEFYPMRDMIRDEFDAIWRVQAAHHPELLTDERRDAIATVVFRQRDLKPPKIGKCTFEHDEERLPKALPSVEARELYERLAHLRVSTGSVEDRALLPEQRDALASVLLAGGNLTFAKVRKALKLGGNARINFEEAGEKELKGCLTGKLLSKDMMKYQSHAVTAQRVAFRWKDYRCRGKPKVMSLEAHEFIRRFLLHTLPDGFHRIRHYGFLANGRRAEKLALCRKLLDTPPPEEIAQHTDEAAPSRAHPRCPCCGGPMIILATAPQPKRPPFWRDTS